MKAGVIILLVCAFCSVQCRKTYAPLNKNANIDFINMEAGGMRPGNSVRPQPSAPLVPTGGPPAKPPSAPAPVPAPAPKPATPAPAPKPAAPAPTQPPATQKPAVQPVQPNIGPAKPQPSQIKPVPVNPYPVLNPISTPGPGTVKQLVNFYDSQGKASPIRPYSYSQAVKQGKS